MRTTTILVGLAMGSSTALWLLAYDRTPMPWEFVVVIGVAMACGVASLIAGWRNSKWVLAIAVVIVAGSWMAIGLFIFEVLGPEAGSAKICNKYGQPQKKALIRVLSLNVLHGYPDFEEQEKRFANTVAEFRKIDADVLVLQEVWNTATHGNMAERLSEELKFNYVFVRANGSRKRIGFEEGAAILSRGPIRHANHIVLAPRSPIWENRIALSARIQTEHGDLHITGVHLSYESFDAQASHLAKIMRDEKADVIAGDFNATTDSQALRTLESLGFDRATPVATGLRLAHDPAIDHVFVRTTPGFSWKLVGVLWVEFASEKHLAISDHDGIVFEMMPLR